MEEEEKCENPPKRSRKIEKLKDQEEEEEEEKDRISDLEDCLLIDIISRLPETKYAIRTGTLSKRWQHLWPYVHNLIFEFHLPSWRWLHRVLSEYVSFVDKTLTQCPHLNLNKFHLHIPYHFMFKSQVTNWVRYAVACDVQDLHLSVLNKIKESEFVLDQCFFVNSSFKYLWLEGCVFSQVGAISWSILNTLFIGRGKLDEDLIQNILSGCPLLETLQLYDCYGLERIDITSKSVKNFVFSGYNSPEAEDLDYKDIIEINSPYIVSLRITGQLFLWKILLLNVSSLVKANLNYINDGHHETTTRKEGEEELLKAFIQSLRHVQDLKIGHSCVKTLSRLEAKGFILPLNLRVVDKKTVNKREGDDEPGSDRGALKKLKESDNAEDTDEEEPMDVDERERIRPPRPRYRPHDKEAMDEAARFNAFKQTHGKVFPESWFYAKTSVPPPSSPRRPFFDLSQPLPPSIASRRSG